MEAGCDHTAAPAIRRQRRMDVQRGHRDVSPRPEHASSPRPRRQTWPTRKRPPFRPLGHGKGVRRHQEKEEPLPPRERRGAPQDGDPSPQAQATVTDTSGSGTPHSSVKEPFSPGRAAEGGRPSRVSFSLLPPKKRLAFQMARPHQSARRLK